MKALPACSLAVVGAQHPNADGSNRRFEIELLRAGEGVELVLEPTNRADPHAVAVFSYLGGQLGYLSADRCVRIGNIIRQGREVQAVFQASANFGAWIRVAFDGEIPVVDLTARAREPVPMLAEGADPEAEFYPDEVWDD